MTVSMSYFGIIFFVLLPLIAANRIASVSKYSMDSCSERQQPGFICMNCEILATCLYRNNTWESIPLEVCDPDMGLFCNMRDRSCSTSVGPCNPVGQTGNFVCTSAGVYPDPYDCQTYHLCYLNGDNLVAVNIECGPNSAFSAATGTCSLKTNDPVCSEKPFVCDKVGDKGTWPGNQNIFYICMATQVGGNRALFPTLYRCPEGYSFNGEECKLGNNVPGIFPPNMPDWNNNNSAMGCSVPGLIADLTNCHHYYYCNNKLLVQRIQCPNGTFFDKDSLSCKPGDC